MKRFTLLFTIALSLVLTSMAYASDKGKADGMKIMRKSVIAEPPSPFYGPNGSSFPMPFNATAGDPILQDRNSTAISTGYYFVDSQDEVGAPWQPEPTYLDTNMEQANWRRIIKGPMTWETSSASQDLGADGRPREGYRYFWNPRQSLDENDPLYDNGDYDSTDNAVAGPIPIGFDFYFNGVRYDSFYVSTNGFITLSNRRYHYDNAGNRKIPGTENNCYDIMSGDWGFRGTNGDGLTDPTPDDWGYTNTTNFLNAFPSGSNLDAFGGTLAIIAPFFGNGYLSQYNPVYQEADDYGKVYFYRNNSGNKLVIYYVNYTLIGTLTRMWQSTGTFNANPNLRSSDNGYIACNAQITLDRSDSSVTYNYLDFKGRYNDGLYINESKDVFRWNTYCGVNGLVRLPGYNSKNNTYLNEPWAFGNFQHTHAWGQYQLRECDYPNNSQALKFKQWKNTLRYVDIQYKVKPRVKIDGEYSDEYIEDVSTVDAVNYELLAGHDQIGGIQPVVLVQNLTNDAQGPDGVNYQPQDFEFQVEMRIKNLALNKDIYTKTVKVDSLSIATRSNSDGNAYSKVILSNVKFQSNNYIADNNALYDNVGTDELPVWVLKLDDRGNDVSGVPPYHYVQVYFPPFEPNENFDEQIGRMEATMRCVPKNPHNNSSYRDMWPFDDETSVNFFSMKRFKATEVFFDDVNEWHQIDGAGAMPSVLKWVNIGCEVVSGEEVSRHPLPPRGVYECHNSEVFPNTTRNSPCIKFYRPSNVGMRSWGGTELRSFPIDMTGKFGARLSLSIQRTTNAPGKDWDRRWSASRWEGVEHRICQDNWYTPEGGYDPDELRVEFALPSPDGVQGIANISLYDVDEVAGIQPSVDGEDRWRYHQRRGGAKAETNMSAFSRFGGGGYMVGFIKTDNPAAPDSAMLPPNYAARDENGLVSDFFDDGIDYKFTRFVIPIPDTIINAPANGAENFRFRIIAHCMNNQFPNQMTDDQDEIYVDNVRIVYSDEEDVDLEVTSVDVNWPYTKQPASQAIRLPVEVELSNNTSLSSPGFWVKVRICDIPTLNTGDTLGSIVYCRTLPVPTLRASQSVILEMPDWNAALNPEGKYRIIANVYVPNDADMDETNDTTYYDYDIEFSDVLAYEPPNNLTNSVPSDPGAKSGRGLTTYGHSKGGTTGAYDPMWGLGADAGDGSGQIAMKFKLDQADTIKGYQAFFSPLNSAKEEISYCIYTGSDDDGNPIDRIDSTLLFSRRGWDDIDKEAKWDEFVTVLLPKPVILPAGVYWVVIAQLGQDGLELGASASRMGMRITKYYLHVLNPADVEMNGSANNHLMIDKAFRVRNTNGNLMNNNVFSFENTVNSKQWEQFMPTADNPGYGFLNFKGMAPDGTNTFSRGTWLPFLRPYLGERLHGEVLDTVLCLDFIDPVELSSFDGIAVDKHIELAWETASETNNYGFYVERRCADDQTAKWSTVTFVKGNGTTKENSRYTFNDYKVRTNVSYFYRLRQVDADGHTICSSYSDEIEVSVNGEYAITLSQNEPNPFANATEIKYYVPNSTNVKFEIFDIYGNTVKTIEQNSVAGENHVIWNGRDENGRTITAGTYIYKMTAGNTVLTRKMQIVK